MPTVSVAASLESYHISDIDEGTTSYFGYVDKGGKWYILKLTSTAVRYCQGTSSYETNWTNRAGLTYGYYDAIF